MLETLTRSTNPITFNKVSGSVFIAENKITSLLENICPKHVVGDFHCFSNNLESLVGGPEYVGRIYACFENKIMSFKGLPKHVGIFRCSSNPIYGIWRLFQDYSKIELFNDYDIIQGNKIILERLYDFLIEIGKINKYYKMKTLMKEIRYFNECNAYFFE